MGPLTEAMALALRWYYGSRACRGVWARFWSLREASGVSTRFATTGGALVVCTVVGCMFTTTSNRGKTNHGRGCGSRASINKNLKNL